MTLCFQDQHTAGLKIFRGGFSCQNWFVKAVDSYEVHNQVEFCWLQIDLSNLFFK